MEIHWAVTLFALLTVGVGADTPANCTYEDIKGLWTLYEGDKIYNNSVNCTNFGTPVSKIQVELRYPDIVIDEFGNKGHWTLIYNQGFEITVNQRTFFAFSYYTQDGDKVKSYCGETFPSWSHDVTLRDWACFYAKKRKSVAVKIHRDPFFNVERANEVLTQDTLSEFVERINNHQTSWTAKVYDAFVGKTHEEILKISGGKRSWVPHRVRAAPANDTIKRAALTLPSSFDWRNVYGMNFVSPVRDQRACGSCYAIAALGMLESRLAVQTNNTLQLELSPEDVISCSKLSQGCHGGFSFLVSKYTKDFGVVEESCNPYQGYVSTCIRQSCLKHYTASYHYVGGYYGACNEELMMIELVNNGPISVALDMHMDFLNYASGIYHHTSLSRFNPFEVTTHEVLLVGYGFDDEIGEKYWILKNSWGADWGDNGYFQMRRGTDDSGIESSAVHATPIP